MRPLSPVPCSAVRSMSSSRARRRAAGPAKTPEKSTAMVEAPRRGGLGGRGRDASRATARRRGAGGRRRGFRLRRRRSGGGRAGLRLERQQRRAHRHLVADLGDDRRDDAGARRRHLERRLVGFERQQRLLGRHRVARLDQNLDDRHVLEVADIGHFDFDFGHRRFSFARASSDQFREARRFSSAPDWGLPGRSRSGRSPP